MAVDVQMVNGDFPLRSLYITGVDLTIQRVEVRLRMFLGEGIIDKTLGIPYTRILSERALEEIAFGSQVRRLILETPGVLALRNFAVVKKDRAVRVSGTIVAGDREAVAFSLEPSSTTGLYNQPYIIFRREV